MEQVLSFYFGQNKLVAGLSSPDKNPQESLELLTYRHSDALPLFFEQVGLEILPLTEAEYKARKDFDSKVFGNFWQMVEREATFELSGTVLSVENLLASPLDAYSQQYKLRFDYQDNSLESIPTLVVFETQISDNSKKRICRFLSTKGFNVVYQENNPVDAFLASKYKKLPDDAKVMVLEAAHEHVFIHTYIGSTSRRDLAETINQDDLDVKLSKLVFERALASATFHVSEEEKTNGYKKLIPKAKEWYDRAQREAQIDIWVGFDFGNQSLAMLNKAEATSLLFRPEHVLNQFQINLSNYKADVPLEKVFLLGDQLTTSTLSNGLRTIHNKVEDVSSANLKTAFLQGLNAHYQSQVFQNYTQKIKAEAEENQSVILRNKWLALVSQAAKDGLSENGLSQILRSLNIDIIDTKDLVRKLIHNHLRNAANKDVVTYQELDLLILKAKNLGGNKSLVEDILQEDKVAVVRENIPTQQQSPPTDNTKTVSQNTPKKKMTDNSNSKVKSSSDKAFVWYAIGGILLIAVLAFAVTWYINRAKTNENTLSSEEESGAKTEQTNNSSENSGENENNTPNETNNNVEGGASAGDLLASDISGEYRGIIYDNELGAEFTKNIRIFDVVINGSKGDFKYTVFPRGKAGEGYVGKIDLDAGTISFDYVENSVFKLGEYRIVANCDNGKHCFEPFKDSAEKRLKKYKD